MCGYLQQDLGIYSLSETGAESKKAELKEHEMKDNRRTINPDEKVTR